MTKNVEDAVKEFEEIVKKSGWIMFIFHCLSKSLVITNGYFLIFFQ